MNTVTITKAEVSINTVRIGGKAVTKMIWEQIPIEDAAWLIGTEDKNWDLLGYVRVSKDTEWYTGHILIAKQGRPFRVPYGLGAFVLIDDGTHEWAKAQKELKAHVDSGAIQQVYIGA